MSKYYYFNEDINTQTVTNLVEQLQNLDGKIELWFSTMGGLKDSMDFLVAYLNSREKEITITLTDAIASAGTLLFVDFKGKIKIHEGLDFILFHCFDRESYSIRKGHSISDKKLTEQDIDGNIIFAKKLKDKGFLNNKQVKQFLKGSDIVLYKKDFKNLQF